MRADVSPLLKKCALLEPRAEAAKVPQQESFTSDLQLPRGAITEITGPVSSGRTSLVHALLARATEAGEFCALIDGSGAFDPWSAAQADVDLPHLLWVRANGQLEAALKSADLILHSGGFGIVVLDLCDAPARDLNRVPLSYWYRFRGAVENTPGRFVVVSHIALAKSCARLPLETRREGARWNAAGGQTILSPPAGQNFQIPHGPWTERSVPLFNGFDFAIENRKRPALPTSARLAG